MTDTEIALRARTMLEHSEYQRDEYPGFVLLRVPYRLWDELTTALNDKEVPDETHRPLV